MPHRQRSISGSTPFLQHRRCDFVDLTRVKPALCQSPPAQEQSGEGEGNAPTRRPRRCVSVSNKARNSQSAAPVHRRCISLEVSGIENLAQVVLAAPKPTDAARLHAVPRRLAKRPPSFTAGCCCAPSLDLPAGATKPLRAKTTEDDHSATQRLWRITAAFRHPRKTSSARHVTNRLPTQCTSWQPGLGNTFLIRRGVYSEARPQSNIGVIPTV
jgi:hypothetical protein